jgi:hypothetical protein
MMAPLVESWGVLLPESFLRSPFFAVLATFVAINTVMYLSLAVAKMLPKVYVGDHLPSSNRRGETRSIHQGDLGPRHRR